MKRLLLSCLLMQPLLLSGQEPDVSDLWYFQLQGPVKHIVIKSFYRIEVDFDKEGRIVYMWQDNHRAIVHRNEAGRIDSVTSVLGRLDDFHNTKYRQRATDEHGNWMARKTQKKPYVIATEYCTTTYYE